MMPAPSLMLLVRRHRSLASNPHASRLYLLSKPARSFSSSAIIIEFGISIKAVCICSRGQYFEFRSPLKLFLRCHRSLSKTRIKSLRRVVFLGGF